MAKKSKDGKVRVAIVGVGNVASSLVQGVQFYKDASDDDFVPGLMHPRVGGYHISDIEFDDSSQASLVQVSVPVKDGGKAIGAITIGVDVDKIQ